MTSISTKIRNKLSYERKRLAVRFNHYMRRNQKISSDEAHMKAAMDWLCRAQDVTGSGGVSARYNVFTGWAPPYPETTGYIITTFLKYASLTGDSIFIERAIRMGDWEIGIQLPSGGVRGEIGLKELPYVFDTGQVLSGWISLYDVTKLSRFLDAAVKAGNWLVDAQDQDGAWTSCAYHGISHVYYTQVAWALLRLYEFTKDAKYRNAGEKNISWALSHALETGWFNRMAFTSEQSQTPYTHTIGYTLQGLIEAHKYLTQETKQNVIRVLGTAGENIIRKYELDSSKSSQLPGTLDSRWESNDKFTCLTGNVQIAIFFLKLHQILNKALYREAAVSLIEGVKATQSLNSRDPGIRGGIAGSWPIWGGYSSNNYPSWATKYFVDALFAEKERY